MALQDFSIDTSGSPQEVQRKQALADALMKQGMDSSAAAGGKNGGMLTALNRGLAGALGGYQRGAASDMEQQGRSQAQQLAAGLLGQDGKVNQQAYVQAASNPWVRSEQLGAVGKVADWQHTADRDKVGDSHWGADYALRKAANERAADKTPFGWVVDGSGARPLENGPYDPNYIAKTNAAKSPASRPLTDEERKAYGLPANTPAAMTAEGPKGIGGGNTVINNAVNPALKDLSEQFSTARGDASNSADTIRYVQNARAELDKSGGVVTGAGANERLNLQKVGALLGVTNPDAITNTETFRTQIKPIVLSTVKGLGAGSGISNADREFAEKAAGGDITLDEKTIRRVLDITERAGRAKIQRYNKLGESMRKTQPDLEQVSPMLNIEEPSAYQTPAAGKPQTVIQNGHTYTLQPDGSYQ